LEQKSSGQALGLGSDIDLSEIEMAPAPGSGWATSVYEEKP